ncbi:MAG: LUD domain-containing protein [Clostridiales bacterium]|nr:LUD domain-containing protein [Clostridiales bacterium]
MFSRFRKKRKIKRTLKDLNLQKALGRASSEHYQKYQKTTQEIPWEDLKKRAQAIREKNADRLPELIERFSEEAERAGASVYRADTPEEALLVVQKIVHQAKAKLIIKSKSMVSGEIKLNSFLEKEGCQVVETDLGEWIIQLAKERPSHMTAPALHKTKEEIAEILSRHLGRPIQADSQEIVRVARQEMRRHFTQADIGISGANLAIAESGTLVIVSNEGNARLVTSLPPVHVALVTTEKFVETMEEAATLIKALVIASSGRKLTSYITFITGPSATTDIEKEHIIGVHGPREVHIIILDNGRLALTEDDDFKKILNCLKCGGCMLVCPIFQAVGGHVFGGPVYPGGIGTLLTAVTRSPDDTSDLLDFCSDCKKCEDFCPVGIPTGELLLRLKEAKKSGMLERSLSLFIRHKAWVENAARIARILQKAWRRDGYIKGLPFSWAKGKRFPVLKKMEATLPLNKTGGPKIYLFQGCLVRHFFPEILESAARALAHFGCQVVSPPDQVCCGAPSLHLGDRQAVKALADQNLESFVRENPDFILTVCPTGNSLLRHHYPKIDERAAFWSERVHDFTRFMVSRGYFPRTSGGGKKTGLYYHYSCHYLHELKAHDEPVKLMKALGYALSPWENPPACCGFCGVFSIKNPELSAHLWGIKKKKITESQASLVATDCPGCLFQLRASLKKEGLPVRSFHSAEILAQSIKNRPEK